MFTIAISTTEENLSKIEKKQYIELKERLGIEIICIVQTSKKIKNKSKKEKWATLYFFNEKGLSKSRNRAIDLAKNKFIFLADDDIIYIKNGIRRAIEEIKKNLNMAAYVFKMKKNNKEDYYSYYPKKRKHLNLLNCGFVSSVTLCINKEFVKKKNIKFDENFGLGTKWPSGEEFILVTDIIKKKGKVLYLPIPIVIHKEKTSSEKTNKKEYYYIRGKVFKRVYGSFFGFLIGVVFIMKNKDILKGLNLIRGLLDRN